ncbi:cornulin-like [Hemicordylus capensis]|uniref:cornulin-like n=1 Tax=Hemicordylus capensis TaxID=884348 RepID=UPI0023031BBA|nr:cornulin-like [Hemicordylus capensis]
MSQLLCNVDSIIRAFDKYARKDGDGSTLSKGELKQLIQKEFAEVIVDPYDPKTIETVLELLDTDCDGKVDFEEFTVLVFKVARACYKKAHEPTQERQLTEQRTTQPSSQKPQMKEQGPISQQKVHHSRSFVGHPDAQNHPEEAIQNQRLISWISEHQKILENNVRPSVLELKLSQK